MRGNAGNIAKVLIMGAMLMLERSALALHQTPGVIEPGDTVSFSVVFNNSQNNQTALEDVRFVLLSAPPWLTSLPTSMIDPVVVPAGESVEFRLDFEVNNAFSLDEAKGEVIAEIKTSSANLNASRLVWQWRTSNGFKTSSAELRDEQGNTFNGSLSPDKEPPDTALSFIGPTFMDSQGALFISSSTALNLEGIDAIVVDAVTSEVAFTGFKLDQQVSDVNLLDAFVGTFTVSSPGNHFIVFGSSDNAGNAESVKISSFIVDAQAPGTPSNLLADGSNPSPWRNISTFTVTLSGSDDASGVAGAFFKVGAVPGFGSDGMFVAGSSSQNFIFQNLIFENLVNGSNPLYVWLQDNVGNTDHATAQIVNLRFDDLKPQSTAAVSASTFSVGPIPVSFTSFDQNGTVGSGMDRTFLWFRRDNNDDGILGDWQQTGLEILGTTGNFIFEIPGLQDGNYEFYTQAKDIAGNFEDAPLGTTPAKAGAFFDASSPIIFNIQVPLIASNFAQIVWTTDDRTTALVEYSTNSAFPAGLTKTKTVGVSTRTHGVFIDCSVLSPAVIYFRITAINKTGLITTSQTGNFTTPANVFIPQDIFGVVDVAKPIAISVTNPGVTMATVTINGQTVFLVLSTSSAAQVFVDTGTVAQGEENVNISLDGFGFNQGVLIDTAQRSARLARLSINSGGGFSEAIGQSQMEIAIGEIGPGPDSSISTTGYLASGGNRLYTGYFAGIDPVSPSAITDLLAQPQGEGSVRLAWSAPGDDAAVGTVMNYDIRFASFALSAENFTQGVKAANPPSPIAAPGNQEFEISNLSDGATYFFAIKAFDELFNESLSNIASTKTLEIAQSTNTVAGEPELALASQVPGITIHHVSTVTVNPAVAIATSAAAVQGLILVSNLFDILSPDPSLPGGATLNFRYQDLGSEALEQELRVYRFDAGLFMWELVADIGPDTANNLFILPITHLSLYAVFLQDEVAPITSLDLLEGRKFVSLSGQVFISSKTAHILSARDPPLGRLAGSGVLGTEFRIDSTALPFNPYIAGSSLSFPAEGFHSIQFRSFDLAHNTEPIKSASLATDNTPPRAVLFSQQPFISIDGGIAVLAPLATVQVIINDPLNNLAASGIDLTGIAYSLDGGSTISVTGLEFSIALGSGTHVLNVSVKDNVGNELNQVFKVLIGDVLPPQSMLMIGPPKLEPASAQDPVFITQNSFLTLISTDDFSLAGDALGLGVAFQKVSMNAAGRFTFNNPNPGQGSAFISSFTLSGEADGLYALEFFAEDVIGNKETAQTTTVAVDNSHPLTSVHISGPQFKAIGDVPGAIGGPLFIATHSLISLDAVDPIVNGAASGLKETKFNIDAGPFEVFASSFTLSEGKRTLLMASKDRLDNEELLKTFEVSVDQTPPQTTVSYAGPAAFPNHPSDAQPSDTDAFITGQTGIVLSAQDPVSQEVASGVKEIKYKINGGEFLVYAGSFTLPAPGVYLIEYFAKDRVDHAEAPRFLKVAVDNAVPETSLAVGQPSFQAFSETLITPETPITLSAVDPLVNNAASGLKEILFSVDQTPLAVYSSTFTLAQGTHTVSFLAKDRLGNAGVMQKKIFHVSALQQHALVTGQGASDLDGNVRIEGSIASSGAFTANGNPVSVSSVIASAIRLVGNATIEGDAILTAGTTDQIELTGNASIKGSRLVNPTLAPQPSPIDLAALLANVSQSNSNHLIPSQYLVNGSLIIKDQTLTLTTGQYLINGLEVTGNGEIKVQGPVALFVRGVVTWEGNALINKTDKASNLLIFSDSSEIFLAKGNVEAAVFVYAPLSSAEIDGNVRLAGHAYFASASIKGNPILYETDGLLPPKEGNNQNNAGNDDEGSKKTASLASAPSQFGPDPAFKLGEIYAFPNPAVSGQRPTLHIESGLADGAQIRVYDMAGELVAESSLSGQPGIVDRGTGIKYAYEHTLDRHLPTDVYLYVVTTQKEGQTLKKAGRFSVVR